MVDRAQAEIYADVADRRPSEDFVALEDPLQPTMDDRCCFQWRPGAVATGFTELDEAQRPASGADGHRGGAPGRESPPLGLDFMRHARSGIGWPASSSRWR